jgi:hypothetical protein
MYSVIRLHPVNICFLPYEEGGSFCGCTLDSRLPYAKIVEDIKKTWEKEFSEGKKLDEGVGILGYDVVALYPSLKIEFMIKMIDKAMV